jgi:hypothetical protein
MESGNPLVMAAVLLAFCVVVIVVGLQQARHGTPVERWARSKGFALISEENELFRSSRILGVAQRLPQVFRIVVRDREGRTRKGRLEWAGSALDPMRVRWDD